MIHEATSPAKLAAIATEAAQASPPDAKRLHAAADLIPVVMVARTSALDVLAQAGFEDVPLPTEAEEAALEASGIRSGLVLDSQPSSNFLNSMSQGFAEASWILAYRFGQSAESSPETAMQTLGQIRALGHAWVAAEQHFHTPEAQRALGVLDKGTTPAAAAQIEAGKVWMDAFRDAAVAARVEQSTPKRERDADELRRDSREIVVLPPREFAAQVAEIMRGRPKLGDQLRQLRLNANLTQSEVADRAFSVSYISAVERGQINPSIDALRKLAFKLGIDIDRAVRMEQFTPEAVALGLTILLNPPKKK